MKIKTAPDSRPVVIASPAESRVKQSRRQVKDWIASKPQLLPMTRWVRRCYFIDASLKHKYKIKVTK
jgi:hypothetical protein